MSVEAGVLGSLNLGGVDLVVVCAGLIVRRRRVVGILGHIVDVVDFCVVGDEKVGGEKGC